MYHVEGEVNDRMKKMADRHLEKMTLTVGQFSPGFFGLPVGQVLGHDTNCHALDSL